MNTYIVKTRAPKGARGGAGALRVFAVVAVRPADAEALALAQSPDGSAVVPLTVRVHGGTAALVALS